MPANRTIFELQEVNPPLRPVRCFPRFSPAGRRMHASSLTTNHPKPPLSLRHSCLAPLLHHTDLGDLRGFPGKEDLGPS
jgi:hypothetical protein